MNSTTLSLAVRFLAARVMWPVGILGVVVAFGAGMACAFDSGNAAPAQIVATFERQDFAETSISIDGREARVAGYRTPTETRVSIELPEGLTMLTQATLRVDGKRLMVGSSSADGQVITTVFPTTKLDAPVQFELGAVARFHGESAFFTVTMRDVLKEADGDSEFPIPASAVVAGEASRVISGEQGRSGSRKWVGIEVVGNWQSNDPEAPPIIFDGKGQRLLRAHVHSSYRKDINGTVSEGTSRIAAFVDGDSDLSQLTFVLSPSTVPDGQAYSVQLKPE